MRFIKFIIKNGSSNVDRRGLDFLWDARGVWVIVVIDYKAK